MGLDVRKWLLCLMGTTNVQHRLRPAPYLVIDAVHSIHCHNIIYTFLGSIFELCYIQNRVMTNRVIKRLKCTILFKQENLTTHLAYSADDKSMRFFLFFFFFFFCLFFFFFSQKIKIWNFMQKVSIGDNLHWRQFAWNIKTGLLEKIRKIF